MLTSKHDSVTFPLHLFAAFYLHTQTSDLLSRILRGDSRSEAFLLLGEEYYDALQACLVLLLPNLS